MSDKGPEKLAMVEAKEGTVSLFINGKLERDWNGPGGRSHTQFDDLESAIDDINAANSASIKQAVNAKLEEAAKMSEEHGSDESYPGNGACPCQEEIAGKIRKLKED